MAKPNYQFAKRQRELEKKRKREEKTERRKQAAARGESGPGTVTIDEFGNPVELPVEGADIEGDDADSGDEDGSED